MKRTRLWRTATAGLATAALLAMTTGVASAQLPDLPSDPEGLQEFLEGLDPSALEDLLNELGLPEGTPLDQVLEAIQGGDGDAGGGADGDAEATAGTTAGEIPETGMGGFSGYAEAQGVTVFVGLPAALADGLDPLLAGLGIAGTSPIDGDETSGLRIDLAQVEANLERAAAGEDISSEASAFITNLILGSAELDSPGACSGGPLDVAVPEDAPFLTFSIAGVECEESDERAFADVAIVGLDLRLGALIRQGDTDGQIEEGVQQAIDALNENVLGELNQLLCPVTDGLGLIADNCAAEEPILQLENPFDIDIPLVDLDLIRATAEVTQDGESVTATATSSVAGLNLVGVACADQLHTSTATSDGTTATREASVSPLTGATCNTDQTLFQLLLGDGPLGDVGVFDAILQQDLLDGALTPVFEGLDQLLDALTTQALTEGSANLGPIEGAGTTASTSPFVVAQTIPFDAIEPLEALGEIRVIVAGGSTAVGVNALPAGVEPPAQPVTPAGPGDPGDPTPARLPRTGAGAGALLGLAALGAAAALRRRDS